jgi:hypothetical protein
VVGWLQVEVEVRGQLLPLLSRHPQAIFLPLPSECLFCRSLRFPFEFKEEIGGTHVSRIAWDKQSGNYMGRGKAEPTVYGAPVLGVLPLSRGCCGWPGEVGRIMFCAMYQMRVEK